MLADDEELDNKLRTAARTSTSLENRMRAMKKKLRSDIRSTGQLLTPDDDEAAVIITKIIKGLPSHRRLSIMLVRYLPAHSLRRIIPHHDARLQSASLDIAVIRRKDNVYLGSKLRPRLLL